jgi:hypothetical protein
VLYAVIRANRRRGVPSRVLLRRDILDGMGWGIPATIAFRRDYKFLDDGTMPSSLLERTIVLNYQSVELMRLLARCQTSPKTALGTQMIKVIV